MKVVGYDLKERNLIMNSEYARSNQPELQSFLYSHPKITSLEYAKLSIKEQENILRQALLVTLKMCKEEWRIVKGIGNEYKLHVLETKSEHCQICNTKIRYLFYIRNDLTKTELCVGCECIKKYEIDKGNLKDFNATSAKQIQALLRIQALRKLDSAYPNIQNYVQNHKNYLRNNTYVLSAMIKRNYLEKYQSLSSSINLFLDGNKQITLQYIGKLYADLQNLILEHQIFFEQQEANQWALTTKLYQSLIGNPTTDQKEVLQQLLLTATISADALQLLSDSKFRHMVLSKIAEKFKTSSFQIHRISNDGSYIYLDFRLENRIHKLIVYYTEFVNSFGELLFNDDFSPISEFDYIKKNNYKVDEQFYPFALSNIEEIFPRGIFFYREDKSIIIVENRSFLVFSDTEGPTCYMELEFGSKINRLYRWYLLKDIKSIQEWALEMKGKRNTSNKLEDLHNTITAYSRGVIDDKKFVRRR